MSRIQQLSPHVVNKIAAGEVIERPASVVKELLENSVDALASRIEVEVADGGAELIRIVDDGEGIHPDDILLAVTSHATSKLREADDLFRVQTLGFRGEALASIAEVSQFRLRTRQADQAAGTELEVNGGIISPPTVCGCPVGTQIEIRQLFLNTPVRRKFLKTASTELSHISEQFTRIALANPRLRLVLKHNQKTVYEVPATERLSERLQLFYGGELAEKLIWVESELNGVRIWGYVGHPSQSKSTRKGQYLFLNGRWIQDRTLQHALGEAYRGLLMVGRYPVAFLFLEMPADLVDVNVHPTKSEVRFRDSQQLYRLLLSALRTKFLGMSLDTEFKVKASGPAAGGGLKLTPPDPQRQLQLQHDLADWAKNQLGNWSPSAAAETDFESDPFGTASRTATLPLPGPAAPPASPFWSNFNETPGNIAALPELPRAASFDADAEFRAIAAASDESWSADAPPRPLDPAPSRPAPAPVRAMQVHDSYLVVEESDGLTVIDQHALHERVMYEQFRARVLAGAVESQRLLLPEALELNAAEVALLLEHATTLGQLGLGIEEFGGNTLLLRSYPVMLGKSDLAQLVRDIAEQLAGSGQTPTRRDILDELLHMMACKAAIKAGQRLTPEEIESLLAQRHLIDDAHHCPHGRPTALVLSRAELDRQFGRLG